MENTTTHLTFTRHEDGVYCARTWPLGSRLYGISKDGGTPPWKLYINGNFAGRFYTRHDAENHAQAYEATSNRYGA